MHHPVAQRVVLSYSADGSEGYVNNDTCDCPASCNVTYYEAELSYSALTVGKFGIGLQSHHKRVGKGSNLEKRAVSQTVVAVLQFYINI